MFLCNGVRINDGSAGTRGFGTPHKVAVPPLAPTEGCRTRIRNPHTQTAPRERVCGSKSAKQERVLRQRLLISVRSNCRRGIQSLSSITSPSTLKRIAQQYRRLREPFCCPGGFRGFGVGRQSCRFTRIPAPKRLHVRYGIGVSSLVCSRVSFMPSRLPRTGATSDSVQRRYTHEPRPSLSKRGHWLSKRIGRKLGCIRAVQL
jgi:hypothetical protein